jgi:leucyl aminopeptidase
VTTLALSDTDPAELTVDAIVVGLHTAEGGCPLLAPGAESVAVAFEGALAHTLSLLGATGAPGEVTKLATFGAITAPVIAAVGLGAPPVDGAYAPDTLRRAAAAAVRALAGSGKVTLALPTPDGDAAGPVLRAVAEGALLGTYRFTGYRSRPANRKDPVKSVALHVADAGDKLAKSESKRATVVAGAVSRARDWVNAAPNQLRPPQFAQQVSEAATAAGLEAEVLDEKMLRKLGYGGILAVGMGSEAPPRLVRLEYAPKAAKNHLALVGKGVTFDTGGYAIKQPVGMWDMKYDMAGAAAVAASMLAIAALKPKVRVTAYLPMVENMISGSAYRPGDVITMYGGKRVEIFNPDAEGRLVLADAVVRAQEDEPDYLFEVSTLTAGQVVALGKRIAGVMGSAEMCDRVRRAGEAVGEPAWHMPLPDDVRRGMDSDVADISQTNASGDRAGQMLQGGLFLREFVADGLPWAHLDIAGPAFHSGEASGYLVKGGTGMPVRLMLHLIDDVADNG